MAHLAVHANPSTALDGNDERAVLARRETAASDA
jgi:hypothetical protein